MIRLLTVENLAIINRVEVEFESGLSVLTGETGAGKSILVDALELILGKRAQTRLVRTGARRLSVGLDYDAAQFPRARAWLEQNDFTQEDGACILRRTISADGRSQAYINGAPATLAQLRELTAQLADIVGQNAHQQLLHREHHLALLDSQCEHCGELDEITQVYHRWKTVTAMLSELLEHAQESAAKRDWLRRQITDLEQEALEPGEFERIEQEHRRLSQKENLKSTLHEVHTMLDHADNANAASLLGRAVVELEKLRDSDQDLAAACEHATTALEQTGEAAREVRDFLERIDVSDEYFGQMEQCLGRLSDLARKYRTQPAQLPEMLEQAHAELAKLNAPEADPERLTQERSSLETRYRELAASVSKRRRNAAKALEKAVTATLGKLNMAGAEFGVHFADDDDAVPRPSGRDCVEFTLRANAGQAMQPLAKTASGGELSRVSLAIQMALSKKQPLPVLVFDEVDSGIGGATAGIVGSLLHAIARNAQVLCVTHLPQVASRADHHHRVEKEERGGATQVRIKKLNAQERRHEIARMISGSKITRQSLEHAGQMLAETTPSHGS